MPLNAEQAEIITTFMEALDEPERLFFVQGEGGAGKSYLMNAFIKWAKQRGLKLAICSTTGIASTVLDDGRTVHSTFFAPWKVDETTPVPDWLLGFFRSLNVVVIDEATMIHRNLLHYVDRCLCKAMGDSDIPFGGKLVITMGDWQQVLPVVKGASPMSAFLYCMKNSPLWPKFRTLRLECNQRIRGDGDFRELLRKVGQLHPDIHECIASNYYVATLPEALFVSTEEALIDFTFPPEVLADPVRKWRELVRAAILCPRRATAAHVNELISARLPGEFTDYSARYDPEKPPETRKRGLTEQDEEELDSLYRRIQPGAGTVTNPEFREWWNTSVRRGVQRDEEAEEERVAEEEDESGSPLDKSRYPPVEMQVKLGTILMVIETIDKARGPNFEGRLFNGIRLQVVELRDHALRCRILNLPGELGRTVWIYRRRYLLKRATRGHPAYYMLQFPLHPAFALTINKGQAQTLERVGLHLGDGQVFTHGQLYSAMSRGREASGVRLLSSMGVGRVRNVVLKEALQD